MSKRKPEHYLFYQYVFPVILLVGGSGLIWTALFYIYPKPSFLSFMLYRVVYSILGFICVFFSGYMATMAYRVRKKLEAKQQKEREAMVETVHFSRDSK